MIQVITVGGTLNVDNAKDLRDLFWTLTTHPEISRSEPHLKTIVRIHRYLKDPALWWYAIKNNDNVFMFELQVFRKHMAEIQHHEDVRKEERLRNVVAAIVDLITNPNPRAWDTSSDSDVLRCPLCLMRVPGFNPGRMPISIHADSIYCNSSTFGCPGCDRIFEVRTLQGKVLTLGIKRQELMLTCVNSQGN